MAPSASSCRALRRISFISATNVPARMIYPSFFSEQTPSEVLDVLGGKARGDDFGPSWFLRNEQSIDGLLGITFGASQTDPREVIRVKTRDVVLFGCGDGLLRLDDLNRVGDTCREPVTRLLKSSLC